MTSGTGAGHGRRRVVHLPTVRALVLWPMSRMSYAPDARRDKTARAAKVTPARRRMTAETMEYQAPWEVSAMYTPMREKITAPSDQMSVALLALFMAQA